MQEKVTFQWISNMGSTYEKILDDPDAYITDLELKNFNPDTIFTLQEAWNGIIFTCHNIMAIKIGLYALSLASMHLPTFLYNHIILNHCPSLKNKEERDMVIKDLKQAYFIYNDHMITFFENIKSKAKGWNFVFKEEALDLLDPIRALEISIAESTKEELYKEVIDHYSNGIKCDNLSHFVSSRSTFYRTSRKIESIIDDFDTSLCEYELKRLKPSMDITHNKTAEKLITVLKDPVAKTIGLLALNLVDMGLPTFLPAPVMLKYCPSMRDYDTRIQVVEALSCAAYYHESKSHHEWSYTKFFSEITGNDKWISFKFTPYAFDFLNK